MMRSLFSGVAGLKTHQTRMDVIGNNIANVNTTSYKSQSMVFSDLLYQTTQAASGANAATGRGGINARQIGLGAKTAAISTSITTQGSAQSTNNPFDIMITGDSFFIVSDGTQNFFTRDGSFTVDGAGNLVMSSTGFTVMGWEVDKETGNIIKDTVKPLRVMEGDNMTYKAEYTTKAVATGIVDKQDAQLNSTAGRAMTLTVYDALGYAYTAKFSIHNLDADGEYYVQLDDILDSKGVSLVDVYNLSSISEIATFGSEQNIETTALYQLLDTAEYDSDTGKYSMKYNPGNILDGYSSNQLINAATSTKISAVNGTAVVAGTNEYAIDENQNVTVTGTIKLSKSELQAPPFNLIYAIDKDNSTDDETKYCYYGTDVDGNSVTLNEDPPNATAWQSVLKKSFPDVIVDNLTVNNDGSIEMNFTQDFKSLKKATYHLDKDYFVGDEIENPLEAYGLSDTENTKYTFQTTAPDGQAQITKRFTYTGNLLKFSSDDGTFVSIGGADNDTAILNFNEAATSRGGETVTLTHFSDIDIDFSHAMNVNNGGKTTAGLTGGDYENGDGAGRMEGEMTGIEIAQDGKITAYYDNNQSKLLGQIAVANFANAAGLSKQGNNLYSTTMNSGEFNGIGDDITEGGGKMESGVLEMSNVDLSSEFTEMITTQRGFQANSRIITVSDTLLEELVNLKR